MATAINTKRVEEYRRLRFETIDECVAEIQRIIAADESGRLRTQGNWTAGQILTHLAAWVEYGYQGYPIKPPPRLIRWMLRLRLSKMLSQGMPRGVRIPGVKEGTTGMEVTAVNEAGERLIAALQRLGDGEPAPFDSPAFGPMSHEDRIRLNLRHAELHLGFLAY